MKKILLTQNQFALVDDEEYQRLSEYKWCYQKPGYATRRDGRKALLMHRAILNTPKDKFTDHRDGNGLNNQKHNLRICTPKQNARNRIKSENKTSKFKGVSKVIRNAKYQYWEARVWHKDQQIHIGFFKSEHHAALAYDLWANDMYGEFAKTNFPVVKGGDLYS